MAHDLSKHALGNTRSGNAGLTTRLAWAGGLLAAGLTAVAIGGQLGVVHLNAGEMKIVFGKSDQGFTMDIAARNCPPNCGFDINWRPLVR